MDHLTSKLKLYMLKQILNPHNLVKINIGKGIERHSSDSGGS